MHSDVSEQKHAKSAEASLPCSPQERCRAAPQSVPAEQPHQQAPAQHHGKPCARHWEVLSFLVPELWERSPFRVPSSATTATRTSVTLYLAFRQQI